MSHSFDTLIIIRPDDFSRMKASYKRLVRNLPGRSFVFVSNERIKPMLEEADLGDNIRFIDESSILPFSEVRDAMTKRWCPLLQIAEMPRGTVGWYYQQFLKMLCANICEDEYYLVWDGDTIPTKPISMFQEGTNKPYLDLKHECHKDYFDTIEKLLPGMGKCIRKSFISEHMLFSRNMMQALIQKIESNDAIEGRVFWEKIINAISPAKTSDACFSEYETYGTFVAFTDPTLYALREWHSFRMGSVFFELDKMSEEEYQWLSRDFSAVTFEKSMGYCEELASLFHNEEYRKKLSARQILVVVQEELFAGGYYEIWDDENPDSYMDPLAKEE